MSKYKIHIDKPLPDSKTIQGYKDFDALYDHYQVNTRFEFWRNLYRKPRNFAILAIVVAVGALVLDAARDSRIQEQDFFLKTPSEGFMPDSKVINLNEDPYSQEIGSKWNLEIPSGVFVDTFGNEVKGEVSFYYRWLPTAEAWIRRGLPMEDSQHMYASKGVLEIFASQGKKPLKLLPGKTLSLSVPFEDDSRNYQPMQLDTLSRTWKYMIDTSWVQLWDSSALTSFGNRPVMDSASEELVAKASQNRPSPPARPFGVEVQNKNQYPYFKNYEKVYWEYLDLPGSANPWKENLLGKENGWNKVRIRKVGKDKFTLTFSKILGNGNMVQKKVIARPLYKASSKQEAEKIYQKNLQAYNDALASIERERQELEAQRKIAYQQSVRQWEAKKQNSIVSNGTLCKIRIHQLGFIGLMKELEGKENFDAPKEEDIERMWWSDESGDRLLELSGKNNNMIPAGDSSFIYKIKEGKLTRSYFSEK
ncbi:MAG: hypothetical protein MRZ79_16790 [Bacteroidia bacterium]|nr:hypothetical protein [Bacteroidia bacterium]